MKKRILSFVLALLMMISSVPIHVRAEEEAVPVTAIEISADTDCIAPGETLQLTATILPEDASNQDILWSSLDESVLAVDENGLVTGIAGGCTFVVATAVDGSGVTAQYEIAVFDETSMGEKATYSFSFPYKIYWPVPGYPLSSSLSQGFHADHKAIDIAMGWPSIKGAPIIASSSGEIVRLFKCTLEDHYGKFDLDGCGCEGFGTGCIIRGYDGYYYDYAHMMGGSADHLSIGMKINAGDQIGCVGSTGNSGGYHLHYTIYKKTGNEKIYVNSETDVDYIYVDSADDIPREPPSADTSTEDYLKYHATVTSFSCFAKPKNGGSIQAWKLPWTDTKNGVQNAKLKLTTVSGTFKIKNKVVNHSGNVWYEYETGTSTRGFVYGNEITLLPYAVGADVTNKGTDTAKLVVTWKNPGGIKLVKGGFILKNSSGSTLKTVTENVPQSYQTALDLPCSYEMKTEYKYPLQPNTTYTYVMFVIDSNNKQYEVTGKFTTNAIPVTGVSVSPASSSVQVGKTVQLTASIAPSNASDKGVAWKSSNTAVATVSSSGVVTAKGIGTATITATATDGSGKSGSATITVSCNHSSTVTLPAVAPTCTATGLTEGKKCSTCGAVMVAQTEVAPLDHSYSYKATKAPTTSEAGTLTGTCSKCSGTTTVTLPKLNTTDYTYNVTKEPSYTAAGTGRYTWKTNTYGTYYFDVTLDKMTATLTGIEVAVKPAKTVYEIGESLDTTGLALKATYSDGSVKTITSGFTTNGFDSSTAGEKTVTVTYGGKSASFTVTVEEKEEADPNAPRIVVEGKTVSRGSTVTLEVEIANNPGFSYMKLAAEYDSAVFEFVGATNGAVSNEDFEVSGKNMLWSTD
ncbi:MAG: Ig-like domain-containing protein, partial [Oscillospiraceae bacterium]|nr:Ig-like domain-containing protein [Oscillospiraceae bacterium]